MLSVLVSTTLIVNLCKFNQGNSGGGFGLPFRTGMSLFRTELQNEIMV